VTGTISGTPDSDASQGGPTANGIYSVTVTATDPSGASVDQVFTFTIGNPAPDATDDGFTAAADASLAVVGAALGNDVDPDGDALTVSAVNGVAGNVGTPVAGSTGGLFTVNADGTVSFDPNGEFDALPPGDTATTTVTYTISDGQGGTDTATITVTVTGVNDAPVAINVNVVTDQGSPVRVPVLSNDSDVDGDGLTVTSVTQGANGTVTIDAVTGNPVYTPNANFTGTDSFTYTISDGNGGTDTATVTVTVTITAVDDPDPGVTPQPPTIVLPEVPVVDDDPRPSTNPDTKDQPTVPEQVDSKVSFSPLYVLREVGELQVERNLVMSGAGAFMDSSLGAEVMGQVPDGMMLQGGMDGLRVRDYAFGEMMGFDPAVHVQHAVRHQPVTSEHGLFVQHAVRASQLEARVRDASINAQTNSAALGVSTLFDAFALGSPGSQASDQSAPQASVARTAAVSSASEAADKDKQQTGARVTSSDAASAQPAEKALVPGQPRASAGFRSQLERWPVTGKITDCP